MGHDRSWLNGPSCITDCCKCTLNDWPVPGQSALKLYWAAEGKAVVSISSNSIETLRCVIMQVMGGGAGRITAVHIVT